jgi:CRISPR-associated protein Cas5h
MRTLIFEIGGEYAQFKKPYSPMSPVSYPFPPPTAVLGMLGAIAGYAKTDYHERLGWQSAKIGVQILNPVRVYRASINLLQTKDGTDAYFRPRAEKNTHTQVPYEFLRRPAYRLYIAGLREEAARCVEDNLRAGRTAYTVVLGLASCLAEIQWIGTQEITPVTAGPWSSATVIPLTSNVEVHYEDGRRYQRFRVPAVMDGQRIVHRYQEVVMAEDGLPIQGQGNTQPFYQINNETIAFL